MTLEEAIKHCEENAKEQRDKAVKCFNGGWSSQILGRSCIKCAEEHEQLAKWLKELKALKEAPQDEWIPITFRDVDDEEYEEIIRRHDYIPREECKVYECRMPDDGHEVLVTTCGGEVCEDIFCADPDYYGFENCSDPGDAIAWMPKPKAYKKEEAE